MSLKEILEKSSNEKKEQLFTELQLYLELFQLEKPTVYHKYINLLKPFFEIIIRIVRTQILKNTIKNPRETQKMAIKNIFSFSDFKGPVPEVDYILIDSSFYYSLESNLKKSNSKIEEKPLKKKKPLILLNKIKIKTIKNKFIEKRKTYIKILNKDPLLVNDIDKQTLQSFTDFLKKTYPNDFKEMEKDKKVLIKKTNEQFEESLCQWNTFLEKRKEFENNENRELASKILFTVLKIFETSKNADTKTVNLSQLWNAIFNTLLNSWSYNLKRERFEMIEDETLQHNKIGYNQFLKSPGVAAEFQDFEKYLKDCLINITSLRNDKKIKTNDLSPKNSIKIQKELARVSSPIIEALLSSGILELETSKERKTQYYEENDFISSEAWQENRYNVVRLNLNRSKLNETVYKYEKKFQIEEEGLEENEEL